jgi:hypothetical protein
MILEEASCYSTSSIPKACHGVILVMKTQLMLLLVKPNFCCELLLKWSNKKVEMAADKCA